MCDIAKIRNGDDGRAEHVFVVDESGVWGGVGVALGAEAENSGVFFVNFDADDAVGDDGFVVVGDVRDDVTDLERFVIGRLDVNHGADGIIWLHGARHDGESAEAGNLGADEGDSEDGNSGGDESAKFAAEKFEAGALGSGGGELFERGGSYGLCRSGDVGVRERDDGIINFVIVRLDV